LPAKACSMIRRRLPQERIKIQPPEYMEHRNIGD
jgi:hypothetical protein